MYEDNESMYPRKLSDWKKKTRTNRSGGILVNKMIGLGK